MFAGSCIETTGVTIGNFVKSSIHKYLDLEPKFTYVRGMNKNETLYKYRDWANTYNQRMIVESELYFSSAFNFNDPYDLQLPILFKRGIPFQPKLFMLQFEEKLGKRPTEDELDRAAKIHESYIHENPQILEQEMKRMQDSLANIESKIGVLSLSKVNNCTLMWGHYANSHKGFCVGLDFQKLSHFIKKNFGGHKAILDVIYEDKMPRVGFNASIDELMEYSRIRYSTKFIDWAYEREVRILLNEMANMPLKIPPEIFTEIIFGYKMDADQKKEIMLICEKLYSDISFFDTELSEEFKMNIVSIENSH